MITLYGSDFKIIFCKIFSCEFVDLNLSKEVQFRISFPTSQSLIIYYMHTVFKNMPPTVWDSGSGPSLSLFRPSLAIHILCLSCSIYIPCRVVSPQFEVLSWTEVLKWKFGKSMVLRLPQSYLSLTLTFYGRGHNPVRISTCSQLSLLHANWLPGVPLFSGFSRSSTPHCFLLPHACRSCGY